MAVTRIVVALVTSENLKVIASFMIQLVALLATTADGARNLVLALLVLAG